MKLTDVFIKRPVLSTALGLLVLLLGLQASSSLSVRELPKVTNAVVTVSTLYPGVPQELVQSLVTTPLQTAIADTEGIDYLSATSLLGESRIRAHVQPGYDSDAVLVRIMSKLDGLERKLPEGVHEPLVRKQVGSEIAPFYVGFYSETMNLEQITDYLDRVVQPLFEKVPGVAEVQMLGSSTHAMRVWLNPQAMAAREITPQQVLRALRENNYEAAAAQIEGGFRVASLTTAETADGLKRLEALVLGQSGNSLVRLQDVARLESGSRDQDSEVFVRGRPAVALAVWHSEDANPLTVIGELKQILIGIGQEVPEGLGHEILLDQTTHIANSFDSLSLGIIGTAAIVIFVIFLLTGSLRACLIALVCIALSLLGVTFLMQCMGFSVNRLTLLALLVAIGLVADDAIVVVDQVRKHMEEGRSAFEAALVGARELTPSFLAMTLGVAAMYLPLGLLTKTQAPLWSELALTLAGSVLVSGIVAMTLAPMMSSRLFRAEGTTDTQTAAKRAFASARERYERSLDQSLLHRPVVLTLALVVLASMPILWLYTAKELAPTEDKGVVMGLGTAPVDASIDDTAKYSQDAAKLFENLPESEVSFSIVGFRGTNTTLIATQLKPWDERDRGQGDVRMALQRDLEIVPGLGFDTFVVPPLPVDEMGLPVQLVITNRSKGRDETYKLMTAIQAKAKESGKFYLTEHSLRTSRPQIELQVKTDLAASLGVSMAEIGQALSLAFGDSPIDYLDTEGRSGLVIAELAREFRLSKDMISQVYVATREGTLVPLGTVVELSKSVKPGALEQFDQLASATVRFLPFPWVPMGEVVAFAKDTAAQILPVGFAYDFTGESRQYVQQAPRLVRVFLLAVVILFLMMAAKLESWRGALAVVLAASVALCAVLVFMQAGVSTLNIYSALGLLTLLGLLSKQAVLLVDTANELQAQHGLSETEAIRRASSARFRPVLTTNCAIVVAMIPLLLRSGASAEAHRSLAWVMVIGLSIGAAVTLFVVPVMYSYLFKPSSSILEAPALPERPSSREEDDTPAASVM